MGTMRLDGRRVDPLVFITALRRAVQAGCQPRIVSILRYSLVGRLVADKASEILFKHGRQSVLAHRFGWKGM